MSDRIPSYAEALEELGLRKLLRGDIGRENAKKVGKVFKR